MYGRKILSIMLLIVLVVSLVGSSSRASAMPMDPTDGLKVPHYFGPYPNWALSPLRVPNVFVELTGGGGAGATAAATVDPQSGALLTIDIINPGTGYTSAPTVLITGQAADGVQATATAVVDYSGAVTAITVDPVGAGYVGYTAPAVTISGGGATTDATGSAFGGVFDVTLTDPGAGYTFPTVEFSLPNDPNGVQATGHVICADLGGLPIACPTDGSAMTLAAVVVDSAGSGYSAPPSVTIHNGTAADPIRRRDFSYGNEHTRNPERRSGYLWLRLHLCTRRGIQRYCWRRIRRNRHGSSLNNWDRSRHGHQHHQRRLRLHDPRHQEVR